MKKTLTALMGIVALAYVISECFSGCPLMTDAAHVGLKPTNHQVRNVIELIAISGQLKSSSKHEICESENSASILMLAAENKNGGDKNGKDDEKDDKSEGKDKDEGGTGWDRLWDSPTLG